MEMSSLIKRFNTVNFDRFFKKKEIGTFVLALKAIFVLIVFILLVSMVKEGLNNSLQASTSVDRLNTQFARLAAVPRLEETANRSSVNYRKIAERNLLDIKMVSEEAPAPAPVRQVSRTPLDLIGTFVSDNKSSSYAIIENTQQKLQDVFMYEEDIFGEGTVHGIFADRVEMLREGQIEILAFDETSSSAAPSTAASGPADEEIVVEEAELTEALDNLPMLLTQARAVPFFQDGEAVGLRLFAIRSGSLYEKIGLRNGDILKTINGNSMADLSQAMRLFEELRELRSINLTIERNRQERQFRYEIR